MKIKWLFIGLPFLLLACNLGPLLPNATATPTATETPSPTVTPASTETPSAAPTFAALPTQVPPPTAITCPKGTELRSSENGCYYVTRTPDPDKIYCPDYPHKSGCVNHGCSWNAKDGTCK